MGGVNVGVFIVVVDGGILTVVGVGFFVVVGLMVAVSCVKDSVALVGFFVVVD